MWEALRLAHLLGEGGEKIRIPIIHQPRQLRMLSRSRKACIRYAVARSNYTPRDVLEILMKDDEWTVRMAVAWHSKASNEMLKFLLDDPNEPVRYAVTQHKLYKESCMEERSIV